LDLTGRPSQGDEISKRAAPIGGEPCDGNSPKRRCAMYDFAVSQLTIEGRKHHAYQDVADREDPVSKRQRMESLSKIQSFDGGISAVASQV